MNSLEVNCFPDAGLRRSALHHVSSASQTGTLMWPCYSKFFWTSGNLAFSASPGQLCPLVIPHSLTAQLPLNVDSLPDLGPNSAFDELPKDTTSAPVSSFIFPVSILVVQQIWPPHTIQDEHIALVFSWDVIMLFLFLPVGKMKLCGTRSLQSESGSRVTFTAMTTTSAAGPPRPAPAPICFSEATEAFSLLLLHGVWSFFFSPLWKPSHLSHSDMSIAGYISDYELCEDGHILSMSGALPCVPKAPSVPPKLPLHFLTTFVASWCC